MIDKKRLVAQVVREIDESQASDSDRNEVVWKAFLGAVGHVNIRSTFAVGGSPPACATSIFSIRRRLSHGAIKAGEKILADVLDEVLTDQGPLVQRIGAPLIEKLVLELQDANGHLLQSIRKARLGPKNDFQAKQHELARLAMGRPTRVSLARMVALGVVPRADLRNGAKYHGACRNTHSAVWDARAGVFRYLRETPGDEGREVGEIAGVAVHPEDAAPGDLLFLPTELAG